MLKSIFSSDSILENVSIDINIIKTSINLFVTWPSRIDLYINIFEGDI